MTIFQDLLLYKDEGFVRVQSCVELGQNVLANTATSGHENINNALEALQQEWSTLATKMVDTKVSINFIKIILSFVYVYVLDNLKNATLLLNSNGHLFLFSLGTA